MESQVNLYEILQKRDEIKKEYKKLITRQRLKNQLYELYHKKYNT